MQLLYVGVSVSLLLRMQMASLLASRLLLMEPPSHKARPNDAGADNMHDLVDIWRPALPDTS